MTIKEIKAKSILRTYKRMDSWFISCYGMNLYRGCLHNCVYCDGRSEKYQVNGCFGEDVEVKINAIEVLNKELRLLKKKKSFKKCYILLGGGVGDSYQPIEKTYQLTRKTLELLNHYHLPISILTKSTLIERDIDLFSEVHEKNNLLLNFSFCSTDDDICSIFERGTSSPSEKLKTMKKLKKKGFTLGVFLMPLIPFITDTVTSMKKTIQDFIDIDIDYVIFGGMTLKKGKQKEFFYQTLKEHYPHLLTDYEIIYKNDTWGQATKEYTHSIHETFITLMKNNHIPIRIPASLFNNILSENDTVSVILDQLDYLHKINGKKSPYGYASYQISQLTQPLSTMKFELQNIKGVGPVTEKIITEILNTGTSQYYERLLYRK